MFTTKKKFAIVVIVVFALIPILAKNYIIEVSKTPSQSESFTVIVDDELLLVSGSDCAMLIMLAAYVKGRLIDVTETVTVSVILSPALSTPQETEKKRKEWDGEIVRPIYDLPLDVFYRGSGAT